MTIIQNAQKLPRRSSVSDVASLSNAIISNQLQYIATERVSLALGTERKIPNTLPNTWKRSSKQRFRLLEANRSWEELENKLWEYSFLLVSKRQPLEFSIAPNICQLARTSLSIISSFNKIPDASNYPFLLDSLLCSLALKGNVQLLMFACQELQSDLLLSDEPEYFMQDRAYAGNALTTFSGALDIIEGLQLFDIPVEIQVILGDDDEEAYIFPFVSNPPQLDWVKVNERRTRQILSLSEKLEQRCPVMLEVNSWRELSQPPYPLPIPADFFQALEMREELLREKLLTFFSQKDIDTEIEITEDIFRTWYGGALGIPTEKQIYSIVRAKFLHYGKQGAISYLYFPFAIFLQNERPPMLRTKMLNCLVGKDIWGVVYPFSN